LKKQLPITLAFLLLTSFGFGQTKKIDSLKTLISINSKDSVNVKALNQLGSIYRKIDLDSAIYYTQKSLKNNNNNKAFFKEEISSYNTLGGIEYGKSNFKSAINFFKKSLQVSIKIKNKKGEASTLNNIGLCYKQLGDYVKTMEYYQKSLKLKREINDMKGVVLSLKNLCGFYYYLDKFEEGISIGKEALQLSETHYPEIKTKILNNIGSNYLELKKYNDALSFYEQAFEIDKKNKSAKIYTITLHNIANVLTFLGQHKLAMVKFEEVLSLKKKRGNKVSIAKSEMGIGILAFEMKDYSKSVKHLNNSSKIYEDLNTLYELISINIYLAKSYNKLNQKTKAYNALDASYSLRDSLFYSVGNKEIEEIEAKYETEQKENQILTLKTAAQQKKIVLQKSKNKTTLALGGLFLVIVSGGLYFRKRKKDQKLQVLEASVKSSEEEKKRIGKELHDGIAGGLMTLVHKTEAKDVDLSHKLLNSYNQIRDLSHQLNNTAMHGELFMDRVFEIVPDNKENQVFEVQIDPPYLELNEPYSAHLYRIILELFTNNLKYANASKTSLSLTLKENTLTLLYTDNGKNVTELKKGNGLKSIDNRVVLLNGTLNIDTENGFKVTINIPHKEE
jgi:LPXTG-motif cell wall-anchored protein